MKDQIKESVEIMGAMDAPLNEARLDLEQLNESSIILNAKIISSKFKTKEQLEIFKENLEFIEPTVEQVDETFKNMINKSMELF